ncbi:glycosyltransferase 87 family protein [Hymenobacter aerophilus]|uniref:glycosyltransferase 87 family protein n=1 Tax=Hymenobacter aerophilus TaxID=119644 RepID=UPI0003750D67|nr:glycosyltransferase 87 family protein [Hymenobacter aerophilus]
MKPAHLAALLLSAAAYGLLAYATPRPAFGQLAGLLVLAFGLYVWLLKTGLPLRQGLLAALLLRLLWLPALPALSDDYHRFRWDGLLLSQGQNPYRYRPDELTGPNSAAETHNQQLATIYPRLNSPHYYSVYPPVDQAVFGLAAWLFPDSERGFVVALRVLLLLAEAATAGLLLALLRQFGQPPKRALWYLLNPLVMVELTGNLHFEGLVGCFLLLMLWLLARGRAAAGGAALALAVATKLLPLLVLPLLLRRLPWPRLLRFGLALAVVLAALFMPFLSLELVENIGRSLNLYFRSFEFNASIYYLARAAGQWLSGYNQIALLGPALALLTATGGLLLAATERRPTWATLPRALLLLLTLYFLLATTVHPWYLAPLVLLSCFTRARYALVWSGMIGLSYAAYRTTAYTESLGLVALEYGVVLAVLLLDFRQGRLRGPEVSETSVV